MELTHLDGRKLLIKSGPGEVIAPCTYDPFSEEEVSEWTPHMDCDVPSLENAAVAETEDINVCKKACEKGQLKGKGIGCFVHEEAARPSSSSARTPPSALPATATGQGFDPRPGQRRQPLRSHQPALQRPTRG